MFSFFPTGLLFQMKVLSYTIWCNNSLKQFIDMFPFSDLIFHSHHTCSYHWCYLLPWLFYPYWFLTQLPPSWNFHILPILLPFFGQLNLPLLSQLLLSLLLPYHLNISPFLKISALLTLSLSSSSFSTNPITYNAAYNTFPLYSSNSLSPPPIVISKTSSTSYSSSLFASYISPNSYGATFVLDYFTSSFSRIFIISLLKY